MRRLIALLGLVTVMYCFPVSLDAQTAYGRILGTVTDASGAVVPNANVTVTNLGTGVSNAVRSGREGYYDVPNLIPGKYQVTVEVTGFMKFVASDLVLLVDQKLRVDATLDPGAVTSTVQVTARGQMLNTDTSSVGKVVENKEVTDLPLPGRNFMQLAILSPATVVDPGYLNNAQSSYRPGLSSGVIFVGGGRAASNAYLIDGVQNNDPGFQNPTVVPPIDAIQEFKMMTENYSAEFGGSSSQINVAIKSGTNSIHGTAYDFLRNDALDARDFYAVRDPITGRDKGQLRYNQFGASLGGPIVIPKLVNGRNRLFFFGNYQGLRQRAYGSATGYWATPAELSGDFSAASPIYDPTTGNQFPGNQIPEARIHPKSAAVIAAGLFPTPNIPAQPGYNTVKVLGQAYNVDQVTTRVDAKISDKDTLYGRFSFDTQSLDSPTINIGGATSYVQKGYNAALSEIHLFTPRLVNELRLSWNRPVSLKQQEGAFGTDIAGQFFTGTSKAPAMYGYPNWVFANFHSGVGGANIAPLDYWTNGYSIVEGLTYTIGKHSLKFGADLREFMYKELNSYTSRGYLVFSGQFTGGPENAQGNEIADFLLGFPATANLNQGLSTGWFHARRYNLYALDDWKISPRLTFNLGLRYEYRTPLVEQQDRVSVFNPAYPGGNLLTPNKAIVDQLNSPLLGYTPQRGLMAPDYRNWGPRIGFAFRPSRDNRTVIRAAYGIFYDDFNFNEYVLSVLNAPWSKSYGASGSPGNPIDYDALFPIAPTAAPAPGMVALSWDQQNRTPYVQQWNFSVDRELAHDWMFGLAYVGSKGTRLDDRHLPMQGELLANGNVVFHYPNFGLLVLSSMDGISNYHALTARLEKRFGHGYYLQAHYTWSKSMGLASSECGTGSDTCFGQQNYWNRKADYGLNAYDLTHRVVVTAVYELPFGRGKRLGSSMSGALDKLVGGWQLNGIFQIQSGFPYSIGAIDLSGTGFSAFPRADLVGDPHAPDPEDPSRAFNRYAFAQPAAGTFGNSGRNILRGEGLNNWDLSLFKNTHLTERLNLQFRAEFFNAWNHTQKGPLPGTGFSLDPNSNSGVYLSTQHAPRIIQMALKLIF